MATGDKDSAYGAAGVRYDQMDPFKIECQDACVDTFGELAAHGVEELPWFRGESVRIFRLPDRSLVAHVEEGLGTKCVDADELGELVGGTGYDVVAQDTVAMIVNDMATGGARPFSVQMHVAAGASDWFENKPRRAELIRGWQRGCLLAGAAWTGGETPTLKGIVDPGRVVLSGSALGLVEQEAHLVQGDIEPGDAILFFSASGIHANGLTLAREARRKIEDETALAEWARHLLIPTPLYISFMKALQDAGVRVRYAVNITGHGWRKLMRHPSTFTYRIHTPPHRVPAVFERIASLCGIPLREMYGTFNMGAGFAVMVRRSDLSAALQALIPVAERLHLTVHHAGDVEPGDKRVVIERFGLEFHGEELAIR